MCRVFGIKTGMMILSVGYVTSYYSEPEYLCNRYRCYRINVILAINKEVHGEVRSMVSNNVKVLLRAQNAVDCNPETTNQ